jgi:hypothetical protein
MKKPRQLLAIFCLALLTLIACPIAAQDNALDSSKPYSARRANPVTYEVEFSIVVTPPYNTKKLAVWLPIPQTDVAQEVTGSRLSTFPQSVEPHVANESTFGNRFAYFEFDSPQGAQIIRHQFKITISELHWDLDPGKVQNVRTWPSAFDKYRRGDSQAILVDNRFEELLNEIVPQRGGDYSDLSDVMTWVEQNFAYDHTDASLRANAEHGLLKRRGHCSDYHSFCAAMGRVLGVPTRVTYGINTFPKNSPSHCKLEAFIAPYGWVSFDVSETQKLVSEIRDSKDLVEAARREISALAQARLLSGFRDNTWYLQTWGTDYDLAPPANAGRVPVVRTAYIEADGVPLPEPDPAAKGQTAFSWMCVSQFKPDREIVYPFKNWNSLQVKASQSP